MEQHNESNTITGKDLIAWGHKPGPHFPELLAKANEQLSAGADRGSVKAMLHDLIPPPPRTVPLRDPETVGFSVNVDAENNDEATNIEKVIATMTELMRTPTLEAGAVMPDACPAGPLGTIPVGGIVAAKDAIHPGMHSADICCSVMLTDVGFVEPQRVLDAAESVTHFGPGGRPEGQHMATPSSLLEAFAENPFLREEKTRNFARSHMGTQGDGNHFLFVGRSRSTGRTAIVTHHGSRGVGARLYRNGMQVADRYRQELSPTTLKGNAWIPASSDDGRAYWDALQLVRAWTKQNHAVLHGGVVAAIGAEVTDQYWNEHNFVFERDGLYYHGKGATPAWDNYASDATGLTLIPLNMAEPILVVRGRDAANGLGFSPHGAGRNFSRSEHRRRMGSRTPQDLLREETEGLDIRFHAGKVDASELPSSYKRATAVVDQIDRYGLADVVDHIDPYGCIMAGEVLATWLKKKRG